MQTYTEAIVKKVPKTIASALTTADLGSPDYEKACEQHERYVGALRDCGIEVTVLEADDKFPDSVFIEDTAVVTDRCAIITNPGEETRRGEVHDTAGVLSERYGNVELIRSPGTLDGGDVLQVGDHFYIGLTQRTNPEGAEQLADVLRNHDFDTTFVSVRKFLHLKTGIAYLSNNDLLVAGALRQDRGDPGGGVLRQLHQGQRPRTRAGRLRQDDGGDRREGLRGDRAGDVRVRKIGRRAELLVSAPAVVPDS